jgi:hypothetical protein
LGGTGSGPAKTELGGTGSGPAKTELGGTGSGPAKTELAISLLGGTGSGPANTALAEWLLGGTGNGPANTAKATHVETTSTEATKTLNTFIELVRIDLLSRDIKPQTTLLHKITPNCVWVLTQIGDCKNFPPGVIELMPRW